MSATAEHETTNRELKIFSASSFFNDLGSDMLQPIWPMFVTSVMGAPVEFLGLLDGLGNAVVFLSQTVSGYLSDRVRVRKPFIWIGYLASGAGRLWYRLAASPAFLLPAKALDRMGKMRDTPRDAMLADMYREKRGTAFGIVFAFDNAGAIAGIVLSFLLVQFISIRNVILIAVVPSLIAALLVLLFIKERPPAESAERHTPSAVVPVRQILNRNMILLFASLGTFALSAFSYSFLLLAAGKLGFTVKVAPLLYLIFTAVTAVSAVPFGGLADRIGHKPVLVIGYALWVAAAAGFLLPLPAAFVPLLFVAYGAYLGANTISAKALVSELVSSELRATALGTGAFVTGIMSLPASLTAGVLWDTFGFRASFSFSIVVALCALVLLAFVKERR